MEKYTIEKNIPYPEAPVKKRKYPFDKMEVSDSFFVSKDKEISIKELQMRLNNAACNYCRTHDKSKKFKTAQLEKGVRVWRIK